MPVASPTRTPANLEPWCCYARAETKVACSKSPAWSLYFGDTPDDYTEVCDEHLAEMLSVTGPAMVYPLPSKVTA